MADEEEIVQKVVSFPEVFTYRVPPLTSGAAGYRAEQWNLEQPFSTGPMAVFSKGEVILIKLSSPEKGLIAQITINLDLDQTSPASKLDYWIEQTKDSSRYFVLRMVDQKTKKKALLGVGFRDRAPAFEFQEALIHHFNRVKRWRGIKEKEEDEEEEIAAPESADAVDHDEHSRSTTPKTTVGALSAPIKLNIPGNKKQQAPPPTAPLPVAVPPPAADDDDEWGEFQS